MPKQGRRAGRVNPRCVQSLSATAPVAKMSKPMSVTGLRAMETSRQPTVALVFTLEVVYADANETRSRVTI